MKNSFLVMEDICKSFPGVKALNNVNCSVDKGEILGLCGENGAGKSTLINVLGGIVEKDSGIIKINGKKYEPSDPWDALNKGIAIVHQELSNIPNMTVAENIFAGHLPQKNGLLNKEKLFKKARIILESLEATEIKVDELVNSLTTSQKQIIEIARAIAYNAKIIVMDEPSTSFGNDEVEMLYELIGKLKNQGLTLIYISHKMEEILDVTDKVTVLRNGKSVLTKYTKDLTETELVKSMVGRDVSNLYKKRNKSKKTSYEKNMLNVNNLSKTNTFNQIKFSLKKGEIIGMAGLVGAGRTEIARCIFGADEFDKGNIEVEDKEIDIKSPADAINNGIGYISEDRHDQGLFFNLNVKENIILTFVQNKNFIESKKEKKWAKNYIEKISIKTPSIKVLVSKLSGGNQQKTIIARWLLSNSKILILDEPTKGIDVGSKEEIHKLIYELADSGISILLISSELPEILALSDRVLVINEGNLIEKFNKEEATQEKIMKAVIK